MDSTTNRQVRDRESAQKSVSGIQLKDCQKSRLKENIDIVVQHQQQQQQPQRRQLQQQRRLPPNSKDKGRDDKEEQVKEQAEEPHPEIKQTEFLDQRTCRLTPWTKIADHIAEPWWSKDVDSIALQISPGVTFTLQRRLLSIRELNVL